LAFYGEEYIAYKGGENIIEEKYIKDLENEK
jgi:hypothetical protein